MKDYMTDYKHSDVCYCMYGFDYKHTMERRKAESALCVVSVCLKRILVILIIETGVLLLRLVLQSYLVSQRKQKRGLKHY